MTDTTFTLKEISYRLSKTLKEDDLRFIDRQIKHWTNNDLLRPLGEKHTGTGRSRVYIWHEVVAAAYLHELSAFGVTVGELKKFRKKFDAWMKSANNQIALLGEVNEDLGCFSYLAYYGPARGFDLILATPTELSSMWEIQGSNGKTYNFQSALVINCNKLNERISRN
jgi:hypothetical protein